MGLTSWWANRAQTKKEPEVPTLPPEIPVVEVQPANNQP